MTLTKIVGGFCGALLILLLGKFAGEFIYHTGGGHGDDHHQAYVIDTGEGDHGGEEEAEGPSFAELFVSADVGKGERVFNKCKACHKLEDGANSTGPYLYGVVGRDVAAASGFGYSGALSAAADVWTPQNLSEFLDNPSAYAPGTTMAFSGLGNIEDRANVIAYIDQTDGDTYEIEVPVAEEMTSDEGAAEESATEEMAADEGSAEESATEEMAADEGAAGESGTEEMAADEGAAEESATEEMAADEGAAEESATEEMAADEGAAEESATEEMAADEGAAGESGTDFAGMVSQADPAEGEKVFRKCKACHTVEEGKNRVGPHLFGIVDRDVASAEGFRYSDALTGIDGNWTVDKLSGYLENPKEFAPGNKMSFSGLKEQADRAAVISYLQSVSE